MFSYRCVCVNVCMCVRACVRGVLANAFVHVRLNIRYVVIRKHLAKLLLMLDNACVTMFRYSLP